MKKEFIFILLVLPLFSFSQKIFTTDYPSQSDIKVFVVDYESQSDLNVFRVDYPSQSKGNEGFGSCPSSLIPPMILSISFNIELRILDLEL